MWAPLQLKIGWRDPLAGAMAREIAERTKSSASDRTPSQNVA